MSLAYAVREAHAGTAGSPPPVASRRRPNELWTSLSLRPAVARKANGGEAPTVAPTSVHRTLATRGEPLPAWLQAPMEARLGLELPDVRLHTDELGAASASAIGADAYAAGRHVVFSRGAFDPSSERGRDLLAHELAHAALQPPDVTAPLPVSRPGDVHERAAEQVERGEHVPATGAVVGRKENVRAVDEQVLKGLEAAATAPDTAARDAHREAVLTLIKGLTPGDAFGLYERLHGNDEFAKYVRRDDKVPPDFRERLFLTLALQNPGSPESAATGAAKKAVPPAGFVAAMEEAATLLKGVVFGRADVQSPHVSQTPKRDEEKWDVVKVGTDTSYLRTKAGVLAHDAVSAIVAHPERWSFDCAQFVQVLELYARLKTLGDDEFDKSVGGALELKVHASKGLETAEAFSREGGDSPESLERVLKIAPLGSRVMWRNPTLPADSPSRNWNTVKLGADRFAVQTGSGPQIMTRAQVEDHAASRSTPRGPANLEEIEIYVVPKATK